jgi:hypothetical protein
MHFITLYSIVVTVILAMLLVPQSQQILRHYAILNIMPLRVNHIPSFMLAVPRLQMLRVILEEGVFEHLDKHGPTSVSNIASALNLDEDTLHTYLSNLAFMELIHAYKDKKSGEEIVSLTQVSKSHLLNDSKISMIPLTRLIGSSYASTATALHASERLKTGKLPESAAHASSPGHEFWKLFARASNAMAVETAHDLITAFEKKKIILSREDPRALTIIDTACSSGGYGGTFATRLPNSRVTFFDFDYVIEITKEEISKSFPHVLSRSQFIGGDLFKFDDAELNMFDIALAPQIFHHFGRDECVQLAKTYFKTLKPGGWLGVVEMLRSNGDIPNHPFEFNEFPVMFNLVMKMTTLTGQAFTKGDFVDILESAGFKDVQVIDLFPKPPSLVLARKPN